MTNIKIANTQLAKIISVIAERLKEVPGLDFVYLFGSYCSGKPTVMSDVDIAIYTTPKLPLMDLGKIILDLECELHLPVDMIRLNELYREKPAMAMEIVQTGHLLLCPNKNTHIRFKHLTYLFYLDTQPLRQKVKARFLRRVSAGKFGERNYVE